MEYLIIGLLILIIILVIFSISKNINEGNITERLGKLETNVIKELGEFKSGVSTNLNKSHLQCCRSFLWHLLHSAVLSAILPALRQSRQGKYHLFP